MGSYARITSVDNMCDTEEYITLGRLKESSFTRKRKLEFKNMVRSIIYKKGQTLTLELSRFMKKIEQPEITKQAYSKQRQQLNPKIFTKINIKYIDEEYGDKKMGIKTYKGYLVLSVDGSIIELPNSKELKEKYGMVEGQKNSVGRARARALGIYDSLNKIMLLTTIDPYKVSEKQQFIELESELEEILKEKKYIIVFDRYYFGIAFINYLEEKGIKYIIRMKEQAYKKEKIQMKTNDEEVELKVRTNSIFYASEEQKKILKEKRYIKTRIIKTKITEETEEHLCTNLTKEELNEEEAKELYFTRWNIEKAFDVIKNKINIENFSSKTVIGIEQEFYAQMLVYNMLEDIKKEAMKIEEQRGNKKRKYDYTINMNILAGIFKEEIIEVMLIIDDDIRKLEYIKMLDRMSRYLVPIKPNRKFKRRKMHSMNKYRSNLRRNI